MTIVVTGAAGFIGSALSLRLLSRGDKVAGIDNHNDYYDPKLKEARLARMLDHQNYSHFRIDISDLGSLKECFEKVAPSRVVNLAAQAGVTYSLENPSAYIESNVMGFMNVLEVARLHDVDHLVYASSSSVYGANTALPFSTHDSANHPLSIYAASKKTNELMAHTYSHLYGIPSTGLRFFTVYGPWGRPDMALFKFTEAMLRQEPININNNGNHGRDFTYIDDIVEGIVRVVDQPAAANLGWRSDEPDPASSHAPWRILNIGNNSPVALLDFIAVLERELGVKAIKNFLPLQPGDVPETYADIADLEAFTGYRPKTTVEEGVKNFVSWYQDYYRSSVGR